MPGLSDEIVPRYNHCYFYFYESLSFASVQVYMNVQECKKWPYRLLNVNYYVWILG